jgi:hypothetical protein
VNSNNPQQTEREVRERRVLQAFDEVFDIDEPLPPELVSRAQELYVWRDIDAELLDLLVDSTRDEMALVRDDSLQRYMAFGSPERGIQFECRWARDGFVIEGSVVPSGHYEVRVHRPSSDASASTDMFGSFAIEGIASGSTRLTVRSPDGEVFMMTPWFVLER